MKLLVVDWDFFFPGDEGRSGAGWGEAALYDWGHSEQHPIFFEYIWHIRAAMFMAHDMPLPAIDRSAALAFWGRFQFHHRATLFFADSNMYAAHERIRRNIDEVWLFDAHHDAGYRHDALNRAQQTGEIDCETWMLAYHAQGAELHMRYPQWRHYFSSVEPEPAVPVERALDDGAVNAVVFDRVFVCKSPAWVPSWCDDDWAAFIDAAPLRRKVCLDDSKLLRDFDHDAVAQIASERSKATDTIASSLTGL